MYCNKCGKQIADDSIFCNYCGIKIKSTIDNENKDIIIEACKDCIKKHLKSPSSVIFETIEVKDKDNYGRIYLYAEVDAQNSFGATLRNKLHVVLQQVNEDGTYQVLKEAVYQVSFINTEDVVKRVNKWNKPK
jgi:phenylpyruvate tautomerase PptA (4-oxalocrotonate tautomerase family)